MSHNNQIVTGLQQKKVFKIIVLGDSGVGKTCLTYRFCSRQFLDKPEATIGVDFRERTVRIRDEDIKVNNGLGILCDIVYNNFSAFPHRYCCFSLFFISIILY